MKLFTPAEIGTMRLKNRIVMPAIHTAFGSEDGLVTERLTKYYEERAKGGAGLIIVEFSCVDRRGRSSPFQLMIDNDKAIPGLKKLAKAIKLHGAKAAIQLQHGGVKATAKITRTQPVGPYVFPGYSAGIGPPPRALTIEEINDLVLAFGEAARRAKEAGFDAIELQCAHSYLIDQFMSPRFNKRMDAYGGSIENRARFACEIIECIRGKVGVDYPIICRITGDEYVDGGITLEDAKLTANLLIKSGADSLDVSVGISDNMVSTPPMSFPYGCFVHLAYGIKEAVDAPVIAVGKINDASFAERILMEEKADLIAMGRALIADPFLPKKSERGKHDAILPCIYCNQGCITRVQSGLPMSCLVNPSVGKEMEFPIEAASTPQKVLVVGGGPAGLEAAIMAKEAGHDVILVEKNEYLGGKLAYIGNIPNKKGFRTLLNYLLKQVEKLEVQTLVNKEVTSDLVREIKPNVVILATGATPIMPKIPTVERPNLFLATEVLNGRELPTGSAIVIGGGQKGLETATFLASNGRKVTVLEMSGDVGQNMPPRIRMFLLKSIEEQDIRIMTNREVEEITYTGVHAIHLDKKEEYTAENVVVAVGCNSEKTLLGEIEGLIPGLMGLYVIGDCAEPRNVLEAIQDAAIIVRQL